MFFLDKLQNFNTFLCSRQNVWKNEYFSPSVTIVPSKQLLTSYAITLDALTMHLAVSHEAQCPQIHCLN